ncbi:uncharacterized protein [Drosophila pseudoobscura]|uniref:Spermatogenesis-associated protein 17 n=1 Tax=Drosophila pseudoobscura pseudoobscura TaxID=46245 RepID=A0A6I8USW5_DROPS|nr:uncharacterized protein LOC4803722 [Drosophila pseudoobscura]
MFWDRHRTQVGTRRHTDGKPVSGSSVEDNESELLEEGTSGTQLQLQTLSRTAMLLLDYTHFKAARTIQRHWRGFFSRKTLKKRNQAAITIQRWWRGFSVRKSYFKTVEKMLQNRIEMHYTKAATKIQALFRGWWIRHTVHDMRSLRHMQICAAEELLNCVAFKLHHLLRTYSIPGVYSLKNTTCLSRVEKLLASLNFRFHNGRVRSYMAKRSADAQAERDNFRNNRHLTGVPYKGPNFQSLCPPHCEEALRLSKDMDRRMYKIIEMYDKAQRDSHAQKFHKKIAGKKRLKVLQEKLKLLEKNKRDFCGDVIASMRRWKILGGKRLAVDSNIFQKPENLEKFLHEISDLLEEIDSTPCHCKPPSLDEIACH